MNEQMFPRDGAGDGEGWRCQPWADGKGVQRRTKYWSKISVYFGIISHNTL